MNFITYDVVFLILFVLSISIFLYLKRKNLKKEGFLLLYRTGLGIKIINYVGGKYKKTLEVLSYFSIILGYLLMAGIIYLFGKIIWIYVAFPTIVRQIKVPPIMPLVPYIDKVVPSLPPFYFTYWIIILAIIAITHEFAHGIFMKKYGVDIKSTGFGFFPFFFPIFLAAFVEQDEKSMKKTSKFRQMTILSAGTFANVLTGIFFFIILWLFFSLAFAPAGVKFDVYSYSLVNTSTIISINGVSLDTPTYDRIVELSNKTINIVETEKGKYIIKKEILSSENEQIFEEGKILLYDYAPAINAGLNNIIQEVDGVKTDSIEKLSEVLNNYSPGDEIKIKTIVNGSVEEQEVVLEKNPEGEGVWLGIGFKDYERSGIIGKIIDSLSSFREPHTYYESKFNGLSLFIYNLLWWTVLISISVALINMLPVGIFDGGRFFYLTMLGITGSQRKAKNIFKFVTYFFLFVLLLLMVFWALSFF